MNNIEFSSVVFDFDSTLTAIEGVDFLAELHEVGDQVSAMTEQAMNTYSITADLYKERLRLIQPLRDDLTKLAQAYKKELVPGVTEVADILQSLGKTLYIISGGIRKAIVPVGAFLDIPAANIHAVDVYFSMNGEYIGFDKASALVKPDGKSQIIRNIAPDPPIAFIGDGANDIAAKNTVDRFIGFGGVHHRQPVEEASEYYTKESDFRAILPFVLTSDELDSIDHEKRNNAA